MTKSALSVRLHLMIAKVVLEKYLAFSSGVLDYNVPEKMQPDLKVGQLVKVPFQKNFYNAMVLAVVETKKSLPDKGKTEDLKPQEKKQIQQSSFQKEVATTRNSLKEIEQILCTESFLTEQDLLIAQEISAYYLCSISQVIKLMLPKNFWKNKIHKPKIVNYFLNPHFDFSKQKIRGKNQLAILEFLQKFGKSNLAKIHNLPEYNATTLKGLIAKEIVLVEVKELLPADLITEVAQMKKLNAEQTFAFEAIQKSEKPILLHGITGSGKTEVYLHLIRENLEKGKNALVLVPEIVLTTQIVDYFENVFGNAVGVIHSKLSAGEKEKLWWEIKLGQKKVIIGSRSALFYPYPKLGAIVIDEAHEWSYKNDRSPRYHTHQVAEILAKYHEAKLILGTATPRVEDYYKAVSCEPRAMSARVGSLEKILLKRQGEVASDKFERNQVDISQETNQKTFKVQVGDIEPTKREKISLNKGETGGLKPQGTQQLPLSPFPTKTTHYQLLTLKKRIYEDEISGEKFTRESILPEIKIIDLKEEFQKKNFTPFSDVLIQELKTVLANKEQALLFLNQRGTASSLLCRECGYVIQCKACDVGLTYHQKGSQSKLICHYCGRMQDVPLLCPHCQSPSIKFVGAGTRKIERDLKQLFPLAKIARVDSDTTSAKDAHTELYTKLKNEEIDIVIGTQIIAKGFDLPKVSLVGILNADIGLNVPDFRSGEKIFHVLTQVSGRAGRRAKQGKVFLQTYNPNNFILQAIAKHDYKMFFENEIKIRAELMWPPFSEVIKLTYVDYSIQKVLQKVANLKQILLKFSANKDLQILSAPALIPKMHNKYHWNIILKGKAPDELIRQIKLPPGWRVDRDPVQVS